MSQARPAKHDANGSGAGRFPLARFLLAGGTSAVVNILSRMALSLVMSYEAAIVVAYLCGMTMAYVLNRLFVFAPSGRAVHDEYLRFAIVNIFSLALVWTVSVGLALYLFPAIGFTWHAETIAHVVGVSTTAVSSYFGHRYFSFAAAPESL